MCSWGWSIFPYTVLIGERFFEPQNLPNHRDRYETHQLLLLDSNSGFSARKPSPSERSWSSQVSTETGPKCTDSSGVLGIFVEKEKKLGLSTIPHCWYKELMDLFYTKKSICVLQIGKRHIFGEQNKGPIGLTARFTKTGFRGLGVGVETPCSVWSLHTNKDGS